MGWWQISENPKMVMGDGPADILDRLERKLEEGFMSEDLWRGSLKEIIDDYQYWWGRAPFREEVQAAFEFCRIDSSFETVFEQVLDEFELKDAKAKLAHGVGLGFAMTFKYGTNQ